MDRRSQDITALGVLVGLSAVHGYDPMRGVPGLSVERIGDHLQHMVRRSRVWPYGGDLQHPNSPPRTPKQKRKAVSRAKAQAGRKAAKRNAR